MNPHLAAHVALVGFFAALGLWFPLLGLSLYWLVISIYEISKESTK